MLARRPDRGGAHDQYFRALSAALDEAGIAQPSLVIDRARLNQNVDTVKRTLAGANLPLRVVVKSLPSHGLLNAIATRAEADRYMVFNGQMLGEMARAHPEADLLLGKPLPAAQAAHFLETAGEHPGPQWLIDTPHRLAQYREIARARNRTIRVNFELDVGMHRGGFADTQALAASLREAHEAPECEVSGLMGYDPHVPRVPNPDGAWRRSQEAYAAAIEATREIVGDPSRLTLNGAGSPTYTMHASRGTVANDISIGSAFAQPIGFDQPTLSEHVPASFIATPVIKALARTEVPGVEALSGIFRFLDPNTARAFFIYGGHWMARPVSPPGLEFNGLMGRSSNQELLTGSDAVDLEADDWIFFRPEQSEAVFLQFGDILVYEDGAIIERWPTFPVSA